MVSGNDAAVALAEYIGDTTENFSYLMNKKAQNLGLKSSHFTSPHGLDYEGHYTSAYDLAILTDYALQNNVFSKIVKTQNYIININGHPKSLNNTNELLGYLDGVYGVKTGFTNGANRCLVTACKRKNLDIICVVLGCDTKKDRGKDSIELINYIFNNYSIVNINDIIQNKFKNWKSSNSNYFKINKSIVQSPNIIINDNQIPFEYIAIKNSETDNINITISAKSYINAPVLSGSILGTIKVELPTGSDFTIDLINCCTIKRKNIYYYINMFLKDYFSLLTF